MNKKGLLTLILGILIIACGTTNMAISKEVAAASTQISAEKTAVKRCPCKKIFEERLHMDKEQIKLADTNRKKENEELKPINSKIRADYKKINEIKSANPSDEATMSQTQKLKEELTLLKQQKAEIKVKYNKNFESYLNKDQKQELQKMREEKKAGKSCCPCGKNRYY